jgi:hypothetical protein
MTIKRVLRCPNGCGASWTIYGPRNTYDGFEVENAQALEISKEMEFREHVEECNKDKQKK